MVSIREKHPIYVFSSAMTSMEAAVRGYAAQITNGVSFIVEDEDGYRDRTGQKMVIQDGLVMGTTRADDALRLKRYSLVVSGFLYKDKTGKTTF